MLQILHFWVNSRSFIGLICDGIMRAQSSSGNETACVSIVQLQLWTNMAAISKQLMQYVC